MEQNISLYSKCLFTYGTVNFFLAAYFEIEWSVIEWPALFTLADCVICLTLFGGFLAHQCLQFILRRNMIFRPKTLWALTTLLLTLPFHALIFSAVAIVAIGDMPHLLGTPTRVGQMIKSLILPASVIIFWFGPQVYLSAYLWCYSEETRNAQA